MSRKDFHITAKAFYDARRGVEDATLLAGIGRAQNILTMYLRAAYPRFDPQKFTRACETGEGL